jgi:hypothetical protein
MKLRAFAAAALMALALVSCSTINNIGSAIDVVQGVKINQNQLNAMVASYDTVVLRPYNVYRYSDANYTVPRRYCTKSEPFTVASPCAKYSILVQIQPILKAVDDAHKDLQGIVTACNSNGDQTACTGMQAAIAAFNSAVSIAKTALKQYGVI